MNGIPPVPLRQEQLLQDGAQQMVAAFTGEHKKIISAEKIYEIKDLRKV